MQHTPVRYLSEEDYLALEAQSPRRNEYVAGEIHAMTGASLRHNVIALTFASLLRTHLRGTPCRVFMSDAKLHVAKQQSWYYPDVVVSCDASLQSLDSAHGAVPSPVLVVEILSPTTEGIDRREKALAYRTLPSLKEYAMVSQDEPRVEIHRRNGDIGWDRIVFTPGDTIELASVEMRMKFLGLYEEAGIPLGDAASG
jgi:Uma2 family endonuclease